MTTTHLTIDEMPAAARAESNRIYAFEVPEALRRGAILVDIRSQAQRNREGTLPGALAIERTVLPWRLDPTNSARLALAVDHDVAWIVVCSEGHDSGPAAASLQQLGLHRSADLVGGYQALRAAGLLDVAVGTFHFRREAQAVVAQ